MIKEEIQSIIKEAIIDLQKENTFPAFSIPKILVEYPQEKSHGDYATNVSLQLTKLARRNPLEIGELIKGKLSKDELFNKVDFVAPGFLNFFVSRKRLEVELKDILKKGDGFGTLKNTEKINVEFISANPTGPLTLGNGRGGFCGDVLANTLEKAGYKVTREYYINDRGVQITKLGHSVLKDNEAVYKGEYIDSLKIAGTDPIKVGEKAAQVILKDIIKPSVKKMGISFDVWFSEKNLYKDKEVDKAIDTLTKKGFTYESEKAIWFKSKELGDDKDRVLVRADGERTYFASDIAYILNKFKRGFNQLILFVGADHHGYIARLKAATTALGFEKDKINTIVMQLVRLFDKGKEVRMSKRTGIYVTIDELIDEVGLDAARFFFLTKAPNTHFDFDMSLAKERSSKNPVYYVQYAHARICNIIKKAKLKGSDNLNPLKEKEELDLVKQIIKLPEVIDMVSKDFQVQRLPQYTIEIADSFHRFYEKCRVITEDKDLSAARMSLVLATKQVLENALKIIGVTAPEKM